MSKVFYIVWSDFDVKVTLDNNPAADYYYRCVRHLQHLTLEFNERSNGLLDLDFNDLSSKLTELGLQLGIKVQPNDLNRQEYLNTLHMEYLDTVKTSGVFDRKWLAFHDYIHLLEDAILCQPRSGSIWFDFLDMAGPLTRTLDRSWLTTLGTNHVDRGMCIMQERELGKNPWKYMKDNETDDILQVSKPWIHLKPAFNVLTKTENRSKFFSAQDKQEFLTWFKPNQERWCNHWNITDWNPEEMFMAIPIGTIDQVEEVEHRFKTKKYPTRIRL